MKQTLQREVTLALLAGFIEFSRLLPQAGDWHDLTGHHRYYGSSACNGGERIVESRRGQRPTHMTATAAGASEGAKMRLPDVQLHIGE